MRSFLIVLCIVLWGCATEANGTVYSVSDLKNIKYELSENRVDLEYQAPLETLYYSPGVDYELSEDGTLEIKVVRCKLKDGCKVKAKAKQGDVNEVTIQLATPVSAADIMITDGKEMLSLSGLDG